MHNKGQHYASNFLVQCCLRVFRQHRLGFIPMLSWEPPDQHCAGFLPMQCCPKSIKTTSSRIFFMQCCLELQRKLGIRFFLCNAVPEDDSSRKILHRVKNLSSFVLEISDNNAQKKILFLVVWIFLGQHCTGQNLIQCCPKGSSSHWTGKILCNFVLILLGQHYIRKNYM